MVLRETLSGFTQTDSFMRTASLRWPDGEGCEPGQQMAPRGRRRRQVYGVGLSQTASLRSSGQGEG